MIFFSERNSFVLLFRSTSIKKRSHVNHQHQSPKKVKKQSLIAEYTSSESETTDKEDAVDDIDELLEEVLEKEDKIENKPVLMADPYPSFEVDCRAAINRLIELGDRTKDVLVLRVQVEVRFHRYSSFDMDDLFSFRHDSMMFLRVICQRRMQ